MGAVISKATPTGGLWTLAAVGCVVAIAALAIAIINRTEDTSIPTSGVESTEKIPLHSPKLYVSSVTGSDAVGVDGLKRTKPLASVTHALDLLQEATEKQGLTGVAVIALIDPVYTCSASETVWGFGLHADVRITGDLPPDVVASLEIGANGSSGLPAQQLTFLAPLPTTRQSGADFISAGGVVLPYVARGADVAFVGGRFPASVDVGTTVDLVNPGVTVVGAASGLSIVPRSVGSNIILENVAFMPSSATAGVMLKLGGTGSVGGDFGLGTVQCESPVGVLGSDPSMLTNKWDVDLSSRVKGGGLGFWGNPATIVFNRFSISQETDISNCAFSSAHVLGYGSFTGSRCVFGGDGAPVRVTISHSGVVANLIYCDLYGSNSMVHTADANMGSTLNLSKCSVYGQNPTRGALAAMGAGVVNMSRGAISYSSGGFFEAESGGSLSFSNTSASTTAANVGKVEMGSTVTCAAVYPSMFDSSPTVNVGTLVNQAFTPQQNTMLAVTDGIASFRYVLYP